MLPAGAGAVRFANPEELREYSAKTWGGNVVPVERNSAFEESIFLGLRLREGVSVQVLQNQFGRERVDACGDAVRDLIEGGLVELSDGRWRLTLRGRMVSSEVFGRLLEEVAV